MPTVHTGSEIIDVWSDAQLGAASVFIGRLEGSQQLPSTLVDRINLRTQAAGRTLSSVDSFCRNYSDGKADWNGFSRDVASGALDDFVLGAWLMSVTVNGLPSEATHALTRAMASSSERHDYRSHLSGRLLRRYPTGALSEKIALMMPAILLHLRELYELDLYSPFLIARALGHTGGTRDKLSAIAGFRLPEPGIETIELLRKIGVCYVATSNDFNPADDRLYSLRSSTNTIESDPLIVASIASKMLACPVDLMQLDARWGEGAFFSSRKAANKTAHSICQAISVGGQRAFETITGAHHPDGSTLGATAEIAEAVVCLRDLKSVFDYRGVSYQQWLVADFTSRLVGELFSRKIPEIYNDILRGFADDSFQKPFIRLLSAHGVSETYAQALWDDPTLELKKLRVSSLNSSCTGRLTRLDQVAIGEFLKEHFREWSIVLHGRPGDFINAGDRLFDLYVPPTQGETAALNPDWAIIES